MDTINLISVKQDLVLKIYTQENKSKKKKKEIWQKGQYAELCISRPPKLKVYEEL